MKKLARLFLVAVNVVVILLTFSWSAQAANPCPGRCLAQDEIDKIGAEPAPAGNWDCAAGLICTESQMQGPIMGNAPTPATNNSNSGATDSTTPTMQKCPSGKGECVVLENPLNISDTNAETVIGVVIKAALGLIGSITLFMLVWGGFQWLVAAGNEEKIKQGTQTMVWAVIGLFLVMSSYILLTTYLSYLTGSK